MIVVSIAWLSLLSRSAKQRAKTAYESRIAARAARAVDPKKARNIGISALLLILALAYYGNMSFDDIAGRASHTYVGPGDFLMLTLQLALLLVGGAIITANRIRAFVLRCVST
jgi:hypothetical protein